MKKRLKIILFYGTIFLFVLTSNLLIHEFDLDECWNYGFSVGIFNGQIPYRDFNMVITPFFPFLFASFFPIFGSSIFIYHIEQALLVTVFIYLLKKYLNEKMWLVSIFLVLPLPLFAPNYNFFLLFLFLLLLVLEEKQSHPFILGLVTSLMILTKHTVGAFFLIPLLYHQRKNKKELTLRMLGTLIPLMLFAIYLIYHGAITQFSNYTILGLFDFSKGNGDYFSIGSLTFIAFTLLSIYLKKKKQHLSCNYLFAFLSICIPLFDLYHLSLFFIGLVIVTLKNIEIKRSFKLASILLILGVTLIQGQDFLFNRSPYPNNISNFKYRYINQLGQNHYQEVIEIKESYPSSQLIFLTREAYLYRLALNEPLSVYDLMNKGNLGYHGREKIGNLLLKEEDAIFVVTNSKVRIDEQFELAILEKVLEKSELIEKKTYFTLYRLKKEMA